MKTRMLANMTVSAIGMGCMGISHAEGEPMDDDDAVYVIRSAVDMGYTFFDTAKNYGYVDDPSHNEKVLGKALSGIRDSVVISSKCGVEFDYDVDPYKPPLLYDSSRRNIRDSVEASLRRLHTDHLDLYFQARTDPKVEPEDVADTMAELIREGKILHWGISEADESYLRRAHAVCPLSAVENSYSIINRGHETLIPFLEEYGIGWVAHGPMSKGLLSGTFHTGVTFAPDDWRGRIVNDDNLNRYTALLDYMARLGEEKNATSAQIALAWVLARKPYIVPIPGMRSVARLEENAAATDVTISNEEMQCIDELVNIPGQ